MKAGTVEGEDYTCEYDDYGMVCWGWDENYGDWYCVFDFETEEYACDYGFVAAMKAGTVEGDDYTCEYDDYGMVCWGWDENYGDWYCVFDFETEEYACDYGFLATAMNETIYGDDYTCEYDDSGMVCWGYDDTYGEWYCAFDFETEEYACEYGFMA